MSSRCGTYGSTVGAGAHCATAPATSGPSPNPALIAAAVRDAADDPSPAASEDSRSQVVAALKTAPLTMPASRRPANSAAIDSPPSMSSPVATTDSAAAGRTTARRPTRSDSGPPMSRPGISPRA